MIMDSKILVCIGYYKFGKIIDIKNSLYVKVKVKKKIVWSEWELSEFIKMDMIWF